MLQGCSTQSSQITENKGKPQPTSRFDLFTNIFRKKPQPSEDPCSPEAQEVLLTTPVERTQPVDIPGDPHMGGSRPASRSPVSPRVRSLERDMEVLRQSRQDNPYLQHQLEKLSLQHENEGQETLVKRKDWPSAFSSPRRQDQERLVEPEGDPDSDEGGDDDDAGNLHEHLIRSPPPMFPLNVSQFTFPEVGRGPVSPVRAQQALESRNNQNNSHHHAVLKPKGSLPLISFEEQSQGCPERSPSTSPAFPSPTPVSGRESILNSRGHRLSQGDLNPLLIKSGVDALDPSMRKVLDFQRHGLLTDTPVDMANISEAGRRSVDLTSRPPLTSKLYGHPPPSTASASLGPNFAGPTSSKRWSPSTEGSRPFGPASCSPSLPALDDSCRDPTLGPVKGAKPPPCPAATVRSNYWEY